jgi:hypothetical protein
VVLRHQAAAYRRPYACSCIKYALVSDQRAGAVAANGIVTARIRTISLDDGVYISAKFLRGAAVCCRCSAAAIAAFAASRKHARYCYGQYDYELFLHQVILY